MTKQSVFIKTFGDPPLFRVLDFLIVHEEFDYSLTDIAHLSGVSYSTIKSLWKDLERGGIVTMTRRVGKAKMYRLHDTHPAVVKLKEFYWATVKSAVREKAIAR